ncbi:hypothetical protein K402DRAFT_60342 [Aulographum hederae CBS 113979]|uniref:Uncharacterized protein n=1 Tax=Aulographum hederae CBS 113979 TaxID=1176131 RepID=A0A6G1H1M4_9PEZI|nr:hypothetical protein K402DRAFT_60342 [Aulographum hederae CBS 113979]
MKDTFRLCTQPQSTTRRRHDGSIDPSPKGTPASFQIFHGASIFFFLPLLTLECFVAAQCRYVSTCGTSCYFVETSALQSSPGHLYHSST